jgi:elongation factor P
LDGARNFAGGAAALARRGQVPAKGESMSEEVKATQLRPGMIIRHEGDLYTVHSVDHRTPGNKRGAMATRMRSLRTGSIVDYRFRAEDSIERAVFDEIEFEFLYADGEGHPVYYLIPNTVVKLEFYENKPIGVLLPDTVDLKVVDTEPTLQKATASAVMKSAKLETGLTIQVPPFISNGDKVKVDTSEARYVQRAQ